MKGDENRASKDGMREARGQGSLASGTWSALGLFVLALGIRLVHLTRSPHHDELFHILAARSLLTDGTLIIDGDVPYTRASTYTHLLAGLFRVFGESLVVARMPGVLAGAALVALLFWWVRKEVGSLAAWVAALLLCLDPTGVWISQLGRFYGLHALLFFVGAVAVYGTVSHRPTWPRAALLTALAAVVLILASSLQVTTLVGCLGLLLWTTIPLAPRAVTRFRLTGRRLLLVAAGTVALSGLVLALFSGHLQPLWDRYTFAAPWARGLVGDFLFYHEHLATTYPTLWSLAPVAVVAALALAPGVAGFCTVLFGTVLVVASLGAMKHPRYLFFVMPFFFTLCGIAIGAAIPWLQDRLVDLSRRWARMPRRAAAPLAGVALVAAAAFAAGSNRGPYRTAQMLLAREADVDRYGWQPNWKGATDALHPIVEESDIVASSWPLASWYYLSRLDVSLYASELIEDGDRLPEFTVPRWFLPRPTISEPASLALVMSCSNSGLVIVERAHWRSDWAVSDEMAEYMTDHLERVSLPERWGLLAFRWRTAAPMEDESCRRLQDAATASTAETEAAARDLPTRKATAPNVRPIQREQT